MVSKETIGRRTPDGGVLRSIVLIVGLMLVMTVMTSMTSSDDISAGEVPLADLTDHPMVIVGNAQLEGNATSGNGTFVDPYILEGKTIDATTYSNAIRISNTDAHLIIRNCVLAYADIGNNNVNKCGLLLDNVSNVLVYNVTAYGNERAGIGVDWSDNVTIEGCLLNDNDNPTSTSREGNGVIIRSSENVTVSGCELSGARYTGALIESDGLVVPCHNITVTSCTINDTLYGIHTFNNQVTNLTIDDCVITNNDDYAIYMSNVQVNPRLSGWVISNNFMDNGKLITGADGIFLISLSGADILNNTITGFWGSYALHAQYSDNLSVEGCSIIDNINHGLSVERCEDIVVLDSTFDDNTQDGVRVDDSYRVLVQDCHVEGNGGDGVQVTSSDNVTINGCTVQNSTSYGIYMYTGSSDGNITDNDLMSNSYGVVLSSGTERTMVKDNRFAGNHDATDVYSTQHIQASDSGANNSWNDPSGGNRWADWLTPDTDYDGFVDSPYVILGTTGSSDELPLADPEVIVPEIMITTPVDGSTLDVLQVSIEWQAWDNQSGLQRFEVSVDTDAPLNVDLNTSYQTNLYDGPHSVTVTAFDNAGNSGNDSVQFTVELPTVPGQPSGLTAVPSDSAADLNWTAPDDGGSPITIYHIYRGYDAGNLTEVDTTDQLQLTDSGLVNGNVYYYAVSAENAVGEGPKSETVMVNPTNVPGAPLNLTALVNGTSVELSWEEPEDNGSAILHYNIYRGTNGDPTKIGESNGTMYVDTGLSGDTTYRYQVSAVNAVGEGVKSQEVQAPVVVAPDAPSDLQLSLYDEGVLVEWNVPASDGGSPVLQYNIYRGLSAEDMSLIGNTTAHYFEDTEAVLGSTIHYAVTALNAVGESESSAVRNITYITKPGVPQDLEAEAVTEGIMLTWSAPVNDGGSALTSYRIYYGEGPGPLDQSVTVTATQKLFKGLQPGTTYYFRVLALNGLGMSESTAIVNATFVTTPSAPVNVQAEEEDDGIMLTWSSPAEDGGLDITAYDIYRSVGDGALVLLATVNGTEYLDTDVQNDTTYHYVIKAVNEEGEGEASQQYSITFQPLVPEEGDDGIPWYLFVIPIVVISILLLLLLLLGKKNKDNKRKGREGKE